jgi:hypothetical protein
LAAALRFGDDDRELDADDRELEPERELDEERLRELEDLERLLPERLDPLDFFLPPELPLLRPSAICSPS